MNQRCEVCNALETLKLRGSIAACNEFLCTCTPGFSNSRPIAPVTNVIDIATRKAA